VAAWVPTPLEFALLAVWLPIAVPCAPDTVTGPGAAPVIPNERAAPPRPPPRPQRCGEGDPRYAARNSQRFGKVVHPKRIQAQHSSAASHTAMPAC